MFNSVSGAITDKRFDLLRVDTGGVEWEFLVAARSIDAFGHVGQRTRVYAWLLHRENEMRLFGFPNELDRSLFLELQKVDGIGPRAALKILSGIGAAELSLALDTEDMARLERVPGLGKKTSAKLVLALKGKLPHPEAPAGLARSDSHEDILRALVEMGFERKGASKAVDAAAKEAASAAEVLSGQALEQDIFRRALVSLSA